MQRLVSQIIVLCIVAALSSCDKAPRHVIGESDMVDLLVDIHEAEALIDMEPKLYGNDSVRKSLKQSVFMKHGVTAEKFDTSMVWYSRNMAVYTEVYERVLRNLEKKRDDLDRKAGKVDASIHRHNTGVKYKDFGDTADVWKLGRQLVITSGLGKNMLPFTCMSNQETQSGDKYKLMIKLLNNRASVKSLVGVEYVDGSVTFIERPSTSEGWNEFTVQSDSLKKIKNVFGYIKFDVRSKQTVCYIDSIMLLRTHLDRNTYGMINMQKTLDRNKPTQPDKKEALQEDAKVEEMKTAPIEAPDTRVGDRRLGAARRERVLQQEKAVIEAPEVVVPEKQLSSPKSKKR
ncbi:MAG: DUF4296 domain-containing protein [Muribaculaceae bacterium]